MAMMYRTGDIQNHLDIQNPTSTVAMMYRTGVANDIQNPHDIQKHLRRSNDIQNPHDIQNHLRRSNDIQNRQ